MKSVGEILSSARRAKRWSIAELSRRTKIQERFLVALEACDVGRLPEAPFVKGFIRTVASELDLSPEAMIATFRRDFDVGTRGLIISRMVDTGLRRRFSWSPNITIVSAVVLVVAAFSIYLAFQLKSLIGSPILKIVYPKDNDVVTQEVVVEGATEPTATVSINGQQIRKNKDGSFSQIIPLSDGVHTITVSATGANRKQTTIDRTIRVK